MKLLYFSTSSYGGLADYAHAQADALGGEGFDVTLLCGPDFPERAARYRRLPLLRTHRLFAKRSRPAKAFRMLAETMENYRALATEAERGIYPFVLFGSYAEYFAPLWVPRLRRAPGAVWGSVVHDPVRDAVLGPKWWHRLSVAKAYSFLQFAFVHEATALDTVRSYPALQTKVIPHGPYSFPKSAVSRSEARRRLGLPEEAPVLLVFGHIRDGKNIDLVVRALARFPEAHLVIAGSEQSGRQRPVSFYQELARQQGVADRCYWEIRYIADHEVEGFFAAADFLLLTYNREFRSASGVLNAAVQFRTPCLATSGAGPLQSAVTEYSLGVWREPDDQNALEDGLQALMSHPPAPEWDRYERENSWQRNARIVKESFLSGLPHGATTNQTAPCL